jgi:hypothetical protein
MLPDVNPRNADWAKKTAEVSERASASLVFMFLGWYEDSQDTNRL